MKKRVGVGIIGSGRIGRIHAENLCRHISGGHVVGIADAVPEFAEQCAEACGILQVFPDHQALLGHPAIDAVIICSSTDTHAAMICDAAAAGKHIFCEKPVALDIQAIDKALEAVAAAGVRLQVGFQRRFDSSFRRAYEAISAGEIGDCHILRITSRDPQPPPIEYIRKSGGIFLDMTIHDFDMARFLVQDEVEEIQAFGDVLIDPAIGDAGDNDTAVCVLKFRRGAFGIIDNSRKSAYGYDQRVEVFGSRGMISVGNKVPNDAVVSDDRGVHHPLPLHFFLERYQDAYREEMQSFLDAVLCDKEPEVTGLDGRAPVLMAHAAMRSLAEKRPVRLSEIAF
jgi:myo-inositol 2-dehydrogenase/D-chiro-inositol 1-dehydrogenase